MCFLKHPCYLNFTNLRHWIIWISFEIVWSGRDVAVEIDGVVESRHVHEVFLRRDETRVLLFRAELLFSLRAAFGVCFRVHALELKQARKGRFKTDLRSSSWFAVLQFAQRIAGKPICAGSGRVLRRSVFRFPDRARRMFRDLKKI